MIHWNRAAKNYFVIAFFLLISPSLALAQTFAPTVGMLNSPVDWQTATLLNNGKVLIAGGLRLEINKGK